MFPAKGSERKPAFYPAFDQKVILQVISLASEICIQEMHMDGCYLEVAAYHELNPQFCLWMSTCWKCHAWFPAFGYMCSSLAMSACSGWNTWFLESPCIHTYQLHQFPVCRSGWNHIEASVSAAAIVKRLISIECRTAVGVMWFLVAVGKPCLY